MGKACRRLGTLCFTLLLVITCATSTDAAIVWRDESQPLTEVAEAYRYLLENHIARPAPDQLVQGALTYVVQQAQAEHAITLQPDPRHHTLAGLQEQLQDWHKTYQLGLDQLHRWAIAGMVETLGDPHTAFFTADELRQFRDDLENETIGFGIRFEVREQYLLIKEVLPASPAEEAGLKAGDYVLAVDGLPVSGTELATVLEQLSGERGSTAVLSIYKSAEKQIHELKLTRAVLSVPEVTGARFRGDVGYIRIVTFGSDAAVQFRDELARLSAAGPLKGLIVDLRGNGGGYIVSARDVASLLMEEGLLMHAVNRNGVEVELWVRNGRPVSFPVRILVNQDTASASEMLAGALRDHQIAKLVGTTTFGKGSAQQIITLADGDALKITLEEYYTPNRTVINHVGLEPDIAVEDDVAQVLAALLSLGVREVNLVETAEGRFTVNDVPFSLTRPVFSRDGGTESEQILVRGSVLACLSGASSLAAIDYAPVQSQAYGNGSIQLTKTGKQIVLRFVTGEP